MAQGHESERTRLFGGDAIPDAAIGLAHAWREALLFTLYMDRTSQQLRNSLTECVDPTSNTQCGTHTHGDPPALYDGR